MPIWRKDPVVPPRKAGRCPTHGIRTQEKHCDKTGCGWFVCPKDRHNFSARLYEDRPEGSA